MRRHKPTNTARITVGGKVYSLGRWGSSEAHDRFDTLMAAFLASGRRNLDACMAVIGRPAPPQPTPEPLPPATPRALHDGTGRLTVGDVDGG